MSPDKPSGPIRVLLVDDHPEFLDTATELLEDASDTLEIVQATGTADGLDRLEDRDIDCIVADYRMDEQDGIQFLETVRDRYGELPFIVYTGRGSEEVAAEAISLGVTDYIVKETAPEHYTLLANRIENAVERHRTQQALEASERELRRIHERITDGFFSVDTDWQYTHANEQGARLVDRSPEELIGQTVWEAFPELADTPFEEALRTAMESKETTSIEEYYPPHDAWYNVRVYGDEAGLSIYFRDVSERKERAAELQQQQAETARLKDQLEHALQATDTYVWDWDLESDVIERYPEPDTIFDLADTVLGPGVEDWLERVHPDDRAAVVEQMEEGLEAGTGYEHECRFETGQGTYRWVRVRAVVETESGESVRAIGIVTDVTEQMERERTLRQLVGDIDDVIDTASKEEMAHVANGIAGHVLDVPLVGIHLLSEDGERLEAAAARDEVRDEFGVPPTYDRGGDTAVEELVWEVFQSGESRYIEDTRNHAGLAAETPARSGVVHPLDDYGVLIATTTEPDAFDETERAFVELLAQSLIAVLGRFEREEQLRHQNEQLEDLHRAGQEIIQADTREEIAERVIDGAQSILNYPITMVRYYDESVGGLVPAAATEEVYEVFESRTTFTPDGESLNWSVYESGSPAVFDDINEVEQAVDSDTPVQSLMIVPIGDHGTISVGSTTAHRFDEGDVSLTQLLGTTAELALSNLDREQELLTQRDELRRQNERLDEFASIVSHDLRNPLNVAEGRLSLAAEEYESENLEAVQHALERMGTLIDDMLSLASAGQDLGDLEPVAVSELVERCWENVDTESAELVAASEQRVLADETRLRQLLENLLRNAVEHGGDDTTVTIGDLEGGFYVEDDGPGIPPDERDDVLDPGYSTQEKGTGFGLSIVRDIAEAHDWEISVTEGSDGGARFEFRGVATG